MIIFGGIDGTGDAKGTELNPGEYQEVFMNSFVHRLARSEIVPFSETVYLRGPYTLGMDTRARADAVYKWILPRWKAGTAKAIFLGGYSRGGAAVIEIAKWLKERDNIPVECLILFDPVDRTQTLGGLFNNTPIVSTVKYVVQPIRNYDATWSRWTFKFCGLNLESLAKTIRWRQQFPATHGGMGGTPWTSLGKDSFGNPYETIYETGEPWATKLKPWEDQQGANLVEMFAFPYVRYVFNECQARIERENSTTPNPGFQLPNQNATPIFGGKRRIHIVKSGEWLSKIAQQYYGDPNKWKFLYYDVPENKKKIGPDPNLIEPGQELIIP